MANSLVQPYKGPFTLDLTDLTDTLVDAIPGTTRGLRREKDNIAPALSEIQKGIPLHAATLGVAPDLHERIAAQTTNLEKVRAARVLVTKLGEILDETEIILEDEREGDIGTIVKASRDAARRKDPAVLAAFEQTILYHGQNAARGQATRRKNAELNDGKPAADGEAATPASPPPAP